MKKTIYLCLVSLILNSGINSLSYADEVVNSESFFKTDTTDHYQQINNNNHTGMLIVSGALLSSPCTLETNEVELPLQRNKFGSRYVLKLNVVGCGEGGIVTSANSTAGRDSTMVLQSTLLVESCSDYLPPEQRIVRSGRVVLYGGSNQFTYYLNKNQQRILTELQGGTGCTRGESHMYSSNNNMLLSLQLNYE